MQSIKNKNINKGLCDRFTEAIGITGISKSELAKDMDLKSVSAFNEIARYITEPSKRMIIYLGEQYGISANWILFGIGPRMMVHATDDIDAMLSIVKKIKPHLQKLIDTIQ